MKVLYVIDTLEIGGAERSLYDILTSFREVEPLVCSLYAGNALADRYRSGGIPVISLALPGRYSFGRGVPALVRVIREMTPDLVHTTLFRADVIGRIAGRIRKVPVVSSFVNDSYSVYRFRSLPATGRLKLRGVRLLDGVTARLAVHFVANSEAVKRANSRALGLDPARTTVIHRGRSFERFRRLGGADRQRARAELGVEGDAPLLLNVGRLMERKGQVEAIRAFAELRKTVPGVRLAIAGEGHLRPRLKKLIDELGLSAEVALLGSREDVPALLTAADIFVFPSYFEGLPGAMIEAMLAGTPIVATDIPENRECVEHGSSAHLVPVADPKALAAGVRKVLGDPEYAGRLASNARERAIELFSLDRIACQYEALYSRLLDRAPVAGRS